MRAHAAGCASRLPMLHAALFFAVAASVANDAKFRTDELPLYPLGALKDLVKLERSEDTLVFGHFDRGEGEAAARANFEAAARSFNPGFDKVRIRVGDRDAQSPAADVRVHYR